MKPILTLILGCYSFLLADAQPRISHKKYPSLLWEITGNGLKKPSHLIGTMHVSSKLAFNLPDSFYFAIRSAQVVALESNPETWQEDMNKYQLDDSPAENTSASAYSNFSVVPNEYFSIKTLKFFKYDSRIERALYSNPSSINNLLYRSYGNESSDFEEDTYLDMYIFQCGKKWDKTVTGVEDYGESMKLMAEAYRDAAKDKNIKRRSYGDADEDYSTEKLQEAYRTGNLDLLDTINKYNSVSEAFDEKFLYKRNEIQAESIDSILRSGSSLFVGVGAAHLPGERGVIEILRRKGYRLRPVKMGERASSEKDLVDKIRVPVVFRTEIAADSMYKVDIPGKFYQFGDDPSLEQKQYADMSNGSYYMVTRFMTNAWMWNQRTDEVTRKVDSLLYENIPGKIISKTSITKSGYRGFDITNRTRRGDLQRYHIFITPFEVIFFKMSGNGDYVKNGTEASKFFESIQLKEFRNVDNSPGWIKFSPAYGSFSIDLPHEPHTGNDGSWIFDASDPEAGENYRVMRTDIHNYNFVEEDTFDLALMDESFASSDFIDAQLSRKHQFFKGFPVLESRYRDKQGKQFIVKFIIAGPHYYTLIAHGRKESQAMKKFFNSFQLLPLQYPDPKWQTDSTMYFKVRTPVYPEDKKIKLDIPRYNYYGIVDEEEGTEKDLLEGGTFRNKVISNDTTGEKVFVSFYRSPRYYFSKDSLAFEKDNEYSIFGKDSAWIIRKFTKSETPGKMKTWEVIVSDTNSSRALWGKSFYKDGIGFAIATQIDTLHSPSPFLQSFFDTFTPVDTIRGIDPFAKKSAIFFEDFMSTDSIVHQRAVKYINDIVLDSTDLSPLKKTIDGLNWNEKKYLHTKTALIGKLGDIVTTASASYLRSLYYAADDTVQLQYAILENLLQHKTDYAYSIFRDIILNEPPVLEVSNTSYSDYKYENLYTYRPGSFDNGKFLDELSDSLKLTRTILPELLPLLNLDDYENPIMKLLAEMVDSNLVQTKDYDVYFNKFLLEAKQKMKKQSIAEKKRAIEKAEKDKNGTKPAYFLEAEESDAGNDDLSLYATLLLPYADKNPAVPALIQQMLRSNDKRLKYNTFLLLVKNDKAYPDSLLHYFASLQEYRYELYNDLKLIGKQDRFPMKYKNHRDLGLSSLLDIKVYGKPDSLIYVDRLKTTYREKTGYFYFYKYKEKKDDLNWRIAVVGLVPDDPSKFTFEDPSQVVPTRNSRVYLSYMYNKYSFTGFTETKLTGTEPVATQLKKLQKKLLYSKRKSAKGFYGEESLDTTYLD